MAGPKQKIHDGIYLINRREGNIVHLDVENKLPKIVTVTIDLTGSEGVSIEGTEVMKLTKDIPPRSTEGLVSLMLKRKPKLVTKFKVLLKPLPPSESAALIEKDVSRIREKLKIAKEVFRRLDYNTMDLRLIPAEIGHFMDPHFYPLDSSVYQGAEKHLDTPIHWRRPQDFFRGKWDVFMGSIEPNDICQGKLGDCWFMCALASLAERPALVQRLFHFDEANAEGFYQILFCKGGEWTRVTIDDYFPCFPKEGPIFSRSQGNELWVLLLEKAYAKLHGSYSLLRGGWASEGMMDLTGCPTLSLEFDTPQVHEMIQQKKLWPLLAEYDAKGALISASTGGEDRWTESGGPSQAGGLVPGHAYTVIQAKEAHGNRLLNIRNPWGRFEWGGAWSDSSALWTAEMREALNPTLDALDGTFWMSYEDFLKYYSGVNICRVDNYHEARVRGKFVRKEYTGQEWVIPKWYYVLESKYDSNVILGVHQEDERIYGVEDHRAYLDIGIVVLDGNDGVYRIYKAKEGEKDRQVQLDIELKAGKKYVVWPKTTGCALSRPPGAAAAQPITWYENGEMHPLVESTVKDLFKKANVLVGEDLTYREMHSLMRTVGVEMPEEQFNELLTRLPSHQNGLTAEGLIEFMREMFNLSGEDKIREWFRAWGYDADLFSVKSRSYVLTVHSDNKVIVQMHRVKDLKMNEMINIMLMQGHSEKKGVTDGVNLHCLLEKSANSFTYGIYNTNLYPVTITFDCSNSQGLVFSSGSHTVTTRCDSESWKCLTHAQLQKDATQCRLKPVLRVRRE